MADHDVLVVGAGLAGMRAAIAAHRAGANVAMMSKVHPVRSHQPGGGSIPGQQPSHSHRPRAAGQRWVVHQRHHGRELLLEGDTFQGFRGADAQVPHDHVGTVDGGMVHLLRRDLRHDVGRADARYERREASPCQRVVRYDQDSEHYLYP